MLKTKRCLSQWSVSDQWQGHILSCLWTAKKTWLIWLWCVKKVVYGKKTPSLYHSIKSYNVQWPMSQVATCYRRGVTCDSSWVTCDSSWVTCDCSWVTCDSSLVTCGHLWHRSLNMLRFLLWYIEGVLGCFFPTLLGRSQFDYFDIFYFPKSTFKVVPRETWVTEHTKISYDTAITK